MLTPINNHTCIECAADFKSNNQFDFVCYQCIQKAQQAEKEQKEKLYAIYEYLAKEVLIGNTEFRITFQNNKKFVLHPVPEKNSDNFYGELL